jgi:hypothetical protein
MCALGITFQQQLKFEYEILWRLPAFLTMFISINYGQI